MTWFRGPTPNLHVNNKGREMGAQGSSHQQTQEQQHSRRLKSRSHSISTLNYNSKGSSHNRNIGGVVGSTPYLTHAGSYVYNSYESYYSNPPNGNGLSNSIPTDLWELSPSNSFSPGRLRRHQKQMAEYFAQHYPPPLCSQCQQSRDMYQKQHNQRTPTILETIVNRAKKARGRKGSMGAVTERQPSTSDRARLSAVSCPDVAQQSNANEQMNYGFHYNQIQSKYKESHTDLTNYSIGRQNLQAQNQNPTYYKETNAHLPNCAKYNQSGWTQQRSAEGPAPTKRCSYLYPSFPFITSDTMFQVLLRRDHFGLGLSITGGSDSHEAHPGLIRIRKVFPMGPAFQSARIRPWDIILAANGVPLVGLSNHEALEVLRRTPLDTYLTLSRPPPNIPGFCFPKMNLHSSHPSINLDQSSCLKSHSHSQVSASSMHLSHASLLNDPLSASYTEEQFKSKSLSSLHQSHNNVPPQSYLPSKCGELEITLEKYGGSLGFTLRHEDKNIVGHYVRALVKDPALSDGRIQPGDRILSVNNVDLLEMTHGEAITFLRQCTGKVRLRLYRASADLTPASLLSSPKSIKAKSFRQDLPDKSSATDLPKKSFLRTPKPPPPNTTFGRVSGLKRGKSIPALNDANPSVKPEPSSHGPPPPQVLSAALDRRSRLPPIPPTNSPESGIGVEGARSGLDSCKNYRSEARSSGSGESTPIKAISQCRTNTKSKKIDHRRVNSDPADVDGLRNPKGKTSFRQCTLHLDRISSFEDDTGIGVGLPPKDLNHSDNDMESGFGTGSSHRDHAHGRKSPKFQYGQPAYQSAIIIPSTRTKAVKKKRLSLGPDDIENDEGIQSLGISRMKGLAAALSDTDTCSTLCNSPVDQISSQTTTPLQSNQLSKTEHLVSGSTTSTIDPSSSKDEPRRPRPHLTPSDKSDGPNEWKGVLSPQATHAQDDNDEEDNLDSLDESRSQYNRSDVPGDYEEEQSRESRASSPSNSTLSGTEEVQLPERQSPDGREFRECLRRRGQGLIEIASSKHLQSGEEVFTVQLSRRWCSRLGFSLQGTNGHTFITAVYPDSVAGRDGRLRVGDEVIMVNNEATRNMETAEVIDLMRKARGVISITLLRKPNPEPDTADSANHQLGLT